MRKSKDFNNDTIHKHDDIFTPCSKKYKKLGSYTNSSAAEKRLKSIEWFRRHRNY